MEVTCTSFTALLNYTFENVMYNVMHERISCPTFQTLTDWWKHKSVMIQWRVITHYVKRVVSTLKILIQHDIIGSYHFWIHKIVCFFFL